MRPEDFEGGSVEGLQLKGFVAEPAGSRAFWRAEGYELIPSLLKGWWCEAGAAGGVESGAGAEAAGHERAGGLPPSGGLPRTGGPGVAISFPPPFHAHDLSLICLKFLGASPIESWRVVVAA